MTNMTFPVTSKHTGLIEATMQKLFTRTVQVVDIVDIGSAFRIITLGGAALCDVTWTPGDKIQIQLGGWVQRTYTPMDWDAQTGRTRILVYLHADGPGMQWARTVAEGDTCIVFGPRKSIRIAPAQAPLILFGDETSLGLAVALARQQSGQTVALLLEATALAETLPVLEYLQLDDAHVYSRLPVDQHLIALEEQLSALLPAHPVANIVLTGNASAIQHVSRFLRTQSGSAGRRQSKAYWAVGKTGLD